VVRWSFDAPLLALLEFLWQEVTPRTRAPRRLGLRDEDPSRVYNDFLEKVLAVPTFLGIKPPSERFAGPPTP